MTIRQLVECLLSEKPALKPLVNMALRCLPFPLDQDEDYNIIFGSDRLYVYQERRQLACLTFEEIEGYVNGGRFEDRVQDTSGPIQSNIDDGDRDVSGFQAREVDLCPRSEIP